MSECSTEQFWFYNKNVLTPKSLNESVLKKYYDYVHNKIGTDTGIQDYFKLLLKLFL